MDEHGVRCEAPEALESRQLAARVVVNAFSEVHDEGSIRRSRAEPACDIAARLAARAGRLSGEEKRVCPPVSPHHPNRPPRTQLAIERIVVRNRCHPGE